MLLSKQGAAVTGELGIGQRPRYVRQSPQRTGLLRFGSSNFWVSGVNDGYHDKNNLKNGILERF